MESTVHNKLTKITKLTKLTRRSVSRPYMLPLGLFRSEQKAYYEEHKNRIKDNILTLMLEGNKTKAIATKLNVSERTVKDYITQLTKEKGIDNRFIPTVRLVYLEAVRKGLIPCLD